MYKKLIYLASPYSHADREVALKRVRDVQEATATLIEQGHLVFSPIVHTYPIEDLVSFDSYNRPGEMTGWMAYDYGMIDKSDELWVLRIDGWKESRGVTAELDHARKTNKTVRFVMWPSMTIAKESVA